LGLKIFTGGPKRVSLGIFNSLFGIPGKGGIGMGIPPQFFLACTFLEILGGQRLCACTGFLLFTPRGGGAHIFGPHGEHLTLCRLAPCYKEVPTNLPKGGNPQLRGGAGDPQSIFAGGDRPTYNLRARV